MKIMTCFIDASAWLALTDKNDPNYDVARTYFKKLLDSNAKMITNNAVIDEAVNQLKRKLGGDAAQRFATIIDESILTINLRMDWISRRTRKNSLNQFLKVKNPDLELRHYYIFETVKRKKADIIFSFDHKVEHFGLPIAPRPTISL